MLKYYLPLLFCLIILTSDYSRAQLQIQLKSQSENIDFSEYPVYKANFRFLSNGQTVQISQKDVFINEGAYGIIPESVGPLVNGWQEVRWKLKKTAPDVVNELKYMAVLMINHESRIYSNVLIGWMEPFHNIIITDIQGLQLRDVREGNWIHVQPGKSIPTQIRIKGFLRNKGVETRLKLDSITTRTDIFKIKWLGSDSDPDFSEPPRLIMPSSSYWVNIYFEPEEFKYYHDVLTIHYQGGLKKHVPLYGNTFKLEGKTLIELTEPKDGSVFAPCQTVLLRWKGNAPNLPTEISYTVNDGNSWVTIDKVMGNEYIWTVPDIETDNLRLRVRQDFKQSEEYLLSEDLRTIYSVGYDTVGNKLTSCNINGKILTWNLTNPNFPDIISRAWLGPADESQSFYSFGIVYNKTDREYIVGYRRQNVPINQRGDTLAFYRLGESEPFNKVALPDYFFAGKIITNKKYDIVAVLPSIGAEMLLYSSLDGSFLRSVKFDLPLQDFAFTSHERGIALLFNNNVRIIDLNNFSTVDDFHYDYFLNSVSINMSPDGKLVGLGNVSDGNGLKTDIFVVDLASKQIAKVFGPSIGDPIRIYFNPTSTSLIVGSTLDKQIAFYDLTQSTRGETLFGHYSNMTDLQVAPNGHSLASTAVSNDNLIYRVFTYPEEYISRSMRIIGQELTDDTVRIPFAYLGTNNTHLVTQICNPTDVIIDITEAYFEYKQHFSLVQDWVRDTLLPGECLNLYILYSPSDTGRIVNDLILKTCNKYIRVPFSTYSYPRTVTYFNKPYEMGSVCIGDTVVLRRELFRNDDPVPLLVNYSVTEPISNREFKDETYAKDTLLPPGGTYIANIKFTPLELGIRQADIVVYHSNQTKIRIINEVRGTGIGSFIETSHADLVFIPELDKRELTLKNIGTTDILFTGFSTIPEGLYEILTPTPFTLRPNESRIVEIVKLTEQAELASLIIDANPCLVQKYINLGPYFAQALIELPFVEAEATDTDVSIPIKATISENIKYDGIRPFEAEFEVHAGLFLPTSVETEWGNASITRNTINGNKRTVGFVVNGNFPSNSIIATIKGIAGIAETDRSDLVFVPQSNYFGISTDVNAVNGELLITGLCEDRRIIRSYDYITNIVLSPNPANNIAELKFEANFANSGVIEINDYLGNVALRFDDYSIQNGENRLHINLESLSSGSYTVRIISDGAFSTQMLNIIK